jgi:hypothetical protein
MKKIETEGTKFARKCDITGEGMNEGYCIREGEMYIKTDLDMLQHITDSTDYKTIEDAYENDYYYHTTWIEDDQYIIKDGILIEI